MNFRDIPTDQRDPGNYMEYDTKAAAHGLPVNRQKVPFIGQRLKKYIEPARFQGGVLNDITAQGTFTGNAKKDFIVQISTADATDKLKYSTDGGVTWSVETNLVAGAMVLEDGVTVTPNAITGHALLDEWRFSAWPEPTVAEAVIEPVYSVAEAAAKWGYGSIAHRQLLIALAENPYAPYYMIALDDAGAANAANGEQTIAGPATGPGYIKLHIGLRTIEAAIATGATATEIALAAQAVMERYPDLPVTFAVNAATPGKLNYVAKNKGEVGNAIPLGYEVTAPGVTVATTAMNGGATNPDVDTALAAIFAEQYDIIVCPYTDVTNLGKLGTHLTNVSNGLEQRPAIGVWATTGALASAISLSTQMNHGRMQNKYCRYTSASLRQPIPYELAAAYAADKAAEGDPAMPLNKRPLKTIPVPAVADRLSSQERKACLWGGVSPFKVGPGEKLQVVRAISTYTKNVDGIEDPALLDITTITSLDYARKTWLAALSKRAPKKFTNKAKEKIADILLDEAYKMEKAEILQNVDESFQKLALEKDTSATGRMNGKIPADVVEGLHIFAGIIELTL